LDLVGFIIEIYHDARSYERQTLRLTKKKSIPTVHKRSNKI